MPILPRLSVWQITTAVTGLLVAILLCNIYAPAVRLPLVGAISSGGYKAQLAAQALTLASLRKAAKDANEQALAARAAEEARLTTLAKDTDHALSQKRLDAYRSTDDFIRAGGVPDPVRCGGTTTSSKSSNSQSPDEVRSAPELAISEDVPEQELVSPRIVRVLENDVLICTDNTLRLEAAQQWAEDVNKEE